MASASHVPDKSPYRRCEVILYLDGYGVYQDLQRKRDVSLADTRLFRRNLLHNALDELFQPV
jgi:hypothetical protein